MSLPQLRAPPSRERQPSPFVHNLQLHQQQQRLRSPQTVDFARNAAIGTALSSGSSSPLVAPRGTSNNGSATAIAVSSASSASSAPSSARPGSSAISRAVARNRLRAEVLAETGTAMQRVATENGVMEEILADEHRMVSNADLSAIMTAVLFDRGQSSILAQRKPTTKETKRLALGLPPVSPSPSPSPSAQLQLLESQPRMLRSPAATSSASHHSAAASNGVVPLKARRNPNETQKLLLAGRRDVGAIDSSIDAAQRNNHGRINTGTVNYEVLLQQQRAMNDATLESQREYTKMIDDFVQKQQKLHERFAQAGIL